MIEQLLQLISRDQKQLEIFSTFEKDDPIKIRIEEYFHGRISAFNFVIALLEFQSDIDG